VLFFVNLLVAVASFALSGFSAYLIYLLYDPSSSGSTGWLNWVGLTILGLSLTAVCIVGMRGAHLVSFDLLINYFWAITIFIAPLLLGIVACFDFYGYMFVWFKHEWEYHYFIKVRTIFCEAGNEEKCAMPLSTKDASAWCKSRFNSTDCATLRADGINNAVNWGRTITLTQATISIVDVCLIGLSLYLCKEILRSDKIAKTMNDTINYLLMLPIGGCCGLAYYLWWLQTYETELQYSWLALLFAAMGAAQLIALPLGIYAGRYKSKMLLKIYMCLIVLVIVGLVAGGSIAIIFSGLIIQTFRPDTYQTADIACKKQLTGCCCCQSTSPGLNRCPEWTQSEVLSLLALDLKITGIVALVSVVYLIGAFIIAWIENEHLNNYETDYVGVGVAKPNDASVVTSDDTGQRIHPMAGGERLADYLQDIHNDEENPDIRFESSKQKCVIM